MDANTNLLSLNQAAKAVKKSPSTISKYLKNGKLSYISKDDDGYKIERSELLRVFPDANSETIRENKNWTPKNTKENTREYKDLGTEVEILREREKLKEKEVLILESRIKELQTERDDWKKQAQTLLLQHAPKEPTEKPVERSKGFWATILGKTG